MSTTEIDALRSQLAEAKAEVAHKQAVLDYMDTDLVNEAIAALATKEPK